MSFYVNADIRKAIEDSKYIRDVGDPGMSRVIYLCDPDKNTDCTKVACGQDACHHTTKKEYALHPDADVTKFEYDKISDTYWEV